MSILEFLARPLFAAIAVTATFCLSAASLFAPSIIPFGSGVVTVGTSKPVYVQTEKQNSALEAPIAPTSTTVEPTTAPQPTQPTNPTPTNQCDVCIGGAMPSEDVCYQTCYPYPECPKCEPSAIGGKPHIMCPMIACRIMY